MFNFFRSKSISHNHISEEARVVLADITDESVESISEIVEQSIGTITRETTKELVASTLRALATEVVADIAEVIIGKVASRLLTVIFKINTKTDALEARIEDLEKSFDFLSQVPLLTGMRIAQESLEMVKVEKNEYTNQRLFSAISTLDQAFTIADSFSFFREQKTYILFIQAKCAYEIVGGIPCSYKYLGRALSQHGQDLRHKSDELKLEVKALREEKKGAEFFSNAFSMEPGGGVAALSARAHADKIADEIPKLRKNAEELITKAEKVEKEAFVLQAFSDCLRKS